VFIVDKGMRMDVGLRRACPAPAGCPVFVR
jgi:hypothetical protein